jgi:hypothetical protein
MAAWMVGWSPDGPTVMVDCAQAPETAIPARQSVVNVVNIFFTRLLGFVFIYLGSVSRKSLISDGLKKPFVGKIPKGLVFCGYQR